MSTTAFDPNKFTAESREAWSATASKYGGMSERYFGGFTREFIDFAGIRSGNAVLDVACGAGLATWTAARKTGPGGQVTGVDLAPGMIEVASRKDVPNVKAPKFREMNAEDLRFPDGSFDEVICQLGLMLFAKPAAALAEMVRVARPGGTVACLVQGVPEKMLFTSLIMTAVLRRAPHLKVPGAPTLYAFGPAGLLEKIFSEAGLRDISSRRIAGVFAFASSEAYWDTLTEGAGRMRSILQSLPTDVQRSIRADTLNAAEATRKGAGLEIPFEVVAAKGIK